MSSLSYNQGILAWTKIWVQDQLSSSGPHCAKWVDDQHKPAGFEPRLEPDLPSPNPHYNRSSGHWPCVGSCLVGGSDKYRQFLAGLQPCAQASLPTVWHPCRTGNEINIRLEAVRSSASAGSPLGGRAASLTSLSPLYSAGPCCPV